MNHKKIQARASKKCRVCKEPFIQYRSTQIVCSINCSKTYAETLRVKRERAETREARQRIKPLKEWLKDAETWVNKYVRMRDVNEPCISCGTMANVQYAAGHFRTVKAAGHLRFNLDNIHKQCNSYCNRHLSGNIAEYRPALIRKIGLDRVLALENDNSIKRWTVDEAKEIISMFKLKCKELNNQRG
jgi:hypothetical protein